jgi:hypothetical protein
LCAQALKLKNKINKTNEKVTDKIGIMAWHPCGVFSV